jgi:NADPH:quinone reductase-like Zn-dependent oxidoreductase
VLDPDAILQLPSDMSFQQGAALPLNYRTAILGLDVRRCMRRSAIGGVIGLGVSRKKAAPK